MPRTSKNNPVEKDDDIEIKKHKVSKVIIQQEDKVSSCRLKKEIELELPSPEGMGIVFEGDILRLKF